MSRSPVLGIDPGLQRLATVWAAGPTLGDLRLATIRARNLRDGRRLVYLRDGLRRVLDDAEPEIALLEGYAMAKGQGAHQLGEIGGVIRTELTDREIPYVVVPPKRLKKYFTGDGNAGKDRMLINAQLRVGAAVPVACDDEADALAAHWLGGEAGGWLTVSPVNTPAKVKAAIVAEVRDDMLQASTRSPVLTPIPGV